MLSPLTAHPTQRMQPHQTYEQLSGPDGLPSDV